VAILVLLGWASCAEAQLDSTRYIPIDQVRPGLPAYCLTVYQGTDIEKFGLEVIGVVRNYQPGRDIILVKGTDPRFLHTGPVGGCSGSPVYIDDRLAGALSSAWFYSKDPLYGVTPIEEMLAVGQETSPRQSQPVALSFDLSRPLDLAQVYQQVLSAGPSTRPSSTGLAALPLPLVACGLTSPAAEIVQGLLAPLGLATVTGGSSAQAPAYEDAELKPGSVLAVPLVTGDIQLIIMGTVTEVLGDKVYGFGHAFLGYGAVDLPMASGYVSTVVASLQRSFKLGNALQIKGALHTDEAAAVYGQLGAEPKMIPLTIRVRRYNDTERLYNCRVAVNRLLTPALVNAALVGAVLVRGELPPDHVLSYQVDIALAGGDSITFHNLSCGTGLLDLNLQSTGPIALIMNNPYQQVDITSMSFDVQVAAENILSRIWSVEVSDSQVEPGQVVEVQVVIESYLSRRQTYRYKLQIPPDLPKGKYTLTVSGAADYQKFVAEAAPDQFTAEDLPSLIEAINNLAGIPDDELYLVLSLPAGGLTIQRAVLPDLPASKAIVLTDDKRTLQTKAYQSWVQGRLAVGTIVTDKKTVEITVEQPD
jgi:hypothetical protein